MSWESIPWRVATHLDRPADGVRQALRRLDVWQRAATALGYRIDLTGGEWPDGAAFRVGRTGAGRPRHGAVVRLDDSGLPRIEVLTGPARRAQLRLSAEETGAGTLLTADFGNPGLAGAWPARLRGIVQARHRGAVLRALHTLIGIVVLEQHQTRVVVAGAVIRDGAVLAARRTYPAEAAGMWEFPGGKVGLAETDEQALTRELGEELGILGRVGPQLGPDQSLAVELVLRLYRVDVTGDARPEPLEHDEIRWLTAGKLSSVQWLPADRVLLPVVADALRSPGN